MKMNRTGFIPLVCLIFISCNPKVEKKLELTKELYKFAFHTSHNQFYVYDKDSEKDTGSDKFWSDDAFKRRLAVDVGILSIGTECYGSVKGEIEFLSEKPTISDFTLYDHVVEGDLYINSGILQILDCPNSAIEFEKKVPLGNYRLRIYSSNLASVEGDEGDDYYRIEIWQDKPSEVKLIKEYK